MFQKSLSILILMILLLGIAPSKFSSTVVSAGESIGLQAEVPVGYIGIYSPEDLQKIGTNLSGKYIMMNDIDLAEVTGEGGVFFNNGAGWSSIGNAVNPFTGIFDGNGYKIRGLKMSIKSDHIIYAGLFGYAKKAVITNLGMEDSVIHAENTSMDSTASQVYAGGIVGYASNLTVSNSYISGKVSANSLFEGYAGGIAGYITTDYNAFSSISNSFNSGEISAKTTVGGLVGEARRLNLKDVYNEGEITAKTSEYAGGIVGKLSTSSTIINASNFGTINYGSNGGGLVGLLSSSAISESHNEGALSSTVSSSDGGGIAGYALTSVIKNTYNLGEVSSLASYSTGGGIVGYLASNSSIVESYNNADINMQSYAGGISGNQSGGSVISQSYNTGNIIGSSAGGISGWFNSATIMNSFNIGVIKAKYDGGGIVGHGKNGTIKNTYNSSVIIPSTSYSSYTGGIAGEYEGIIENSYYLENVQKGVGFGVAEGTYKKTSEELKDPTTFEGFDFSTIWKAKEGVGFSFPFLKDMPSKETEQNLTLTMTSMPDKVTYVQGDAFDITGAKITLMTNHGNKIDLPVTNEMISGYNPNKVGYQSLKVSHESVSSLFSVTVKAKYEVVFKDYDGSILKSETVVDGESATVPEAPVREGYTFSGWSRDFSKVKSNLVIDANYTIKSYTVTYHDGKNVLESLPYNHGDWVPQLPNPTKTGYTFVYWYEDPEFQKHFQFYDKLYTNNLNIYAKFIKTPDPVPNFKVEAVGFDKVKVSWDPVKGVDGYGIDYSDSIKEPSKYGYGFDAAQKSYVIDGLKANTTYYFKIKAIKNREDYTVYSPDSQLIKITLSLKGATNVKAVSSAYDKVKVSWTKSSEATGYEVHRATSSNGTYSNVKTITSGTTISYENSSLSTGRTYYFKVRAYHIVDGKKLYSAFSSAVSAQPTLATVTSAKATPTGYNKNKISWAKASGASGYVVYRATSKAGTYSTIKTITSGSTVSYENTGLTTGKTYYYKVRAYRTVEGKKVYGSYSSIASAAPALAKPSKLTLSKVSNTSIKSSWSKVGEASGYELYRATSKTGTYTKVKTQTSGASTTYTNTGLGKGKTYHYKVRAYRIISGKKIYSAYTTIVSAKL